MTTKVTCLIIKFQMEKIEEDELVTLASCMVDCLADCILQVLWFPVTVWCQCQLMLPYVMVEEDRSNMCYEVIFFIYWQWESSRSLGQWLCGNSEAASSMKADADEMLSLKKKNFNIRNLLKKRIVLFCTSPQHCNFNTLRLRQNNCHFADEILWCIFLNENYKVFIQIALKFVAKGFS